jgi:hypothetical protein
MAKAKTYEAEAVLDLPTVLLLRSDLVGLVRPATIDGVDVQVLLPDFRLDGGAFEPLVHSRANIDWAAALADKEDEGDDPGYPFGRVVRRRGETIREFTAYRLLVRPRSKLTRAEARKLRDGADDWASLLGTWIEVVNREDLQRKTVRVERIGESASVWLDRGVDGELFAVRRRVFVNLSKGPTVGKLQWGRMVAKASAGVRPPEAHLFLRDARHEKNIGRHRRSVLDSATAAELGLAKLRDHHLAGSNDRLAAYARKEARQLSGLAEFLKDMDQKLPAKLQQDISEPRNLAIHQGHEPDEATASKALAKAEEVVDLAFPWKKLL